MGQIFKDQTAIITGAAIGIGFEIAFQLAKQGANIILNDIDKHAADYAVKKIIDEGYPCKAIIGDSSNVAFIQKMVNFGVSSFGSVDIVVANAGITTFGNFLTYEIGSFQRLMEVNLQGSFFLAQAAAKQMIVQKKGGRILFMSSVTGHQAHPNLSAYGMTKAALEMLAKSLAVELAEHQITVNAIAPGATITERTLQIDPEFVPMWEKLTPTRKINKTEDIANAALFFLSPHSRQITGQSLIIDGGWTSLSPPPS